MGDQKALVSRAWLRHGIKGMFGTTEPGLLIGREDRVVFVTQKHVVFDAARAGLKVNWPWWEFGAGVHFTVEGKILRISLARPPYADAVALGSDGNLATLANLDPTGLASIGEALASADAWKRYLGA